ncbi:hypothetical protein lbkm_2414 [Lachnospiraceae bacterium KM106-2]|nr:hypothetical protein lbkm_2414 [Lachnospiraceae bacterium KM106-2]
MSNQNKNRVAKTIVRCSYMIGVVAVTLLVIIVLSNSKKLVDPDAMLPTTYQEAAFVWLAIGTIPMLLASIGAYYFGDLKTRIHNKIGMIGFWLPSAICGSCLIYIIGIVLIGIF